MDAGQSLASWVDQVARAAASALGAAESWREAEALLAQFYLAVIHPLLPSLHAELPIPWVAVLKENVPDLSVASIRFGAVNFRGLYRRYGRSTLVEPCGDYAPRCECRERHEELHRFYLAAARGAESINQLMLATTPLQYLSVSLARANGVISRLTVQNDDGDLSVSPALQQRLLPEPLQRRWADISLAFLKDDAIPSQTRQAAMVPEIQSQIDSVVASTVISVLETEFQLVKDLAAAVRNLDVKADLCSKAIRDLAVWLRSLCWLQYYCRDDAAGRYFYTVRMPKLSGTGDSFPDSSVSLVSSAPLPEDAVLAIRKLPSSITKSAGYAILEQAVAKVLVKYLRSIRNISDLTTESLLEKLLPQFTEKAPNVTVDLRKLGFLCRVAGALVGGKHEGRELHFTFIMGWNYDFVDLESKGILDDTGGAAKWPFAGSDSRKQHTLTAQWIKANDIPLQRWDIAMFFSSEDEDATYPICTHLVRIRNVSPEGKQQFVSNAFQLGESLHKITHSSATTAALVVSGNGFTLTLAGKRYVMGYLGEGAAKALVCLNSMGQTLVEIGKQFEEQLLGELVRAFGDRTDLPEVAHAVRTVAEALVALGHGALVAVRRRGHVGDPGMAVLGPVWAFDSEQTLQSLKGDPVGFALLAALDGATEILIPTAVDAGETPLVRFRRRVTASFDIWKEDDRDPLTAVPSESLGPQWAGNWELWARVITMGTRHMSALALSKHHASDTVVVTVSADGLVCIWQDGSPIQKGRDWLFAP